MIITEAGLLKTLKQKKRQAYCLNDGNRNIDEITGGKLPNKGECYKFISLSGGFASVNFIKTIANKEPIEELTASTLRIGEKQFICLSNLSKREKLQRATFFIGSIMEEDAAKNKKYDYYTRFMDTAKNFGWEVYVVNNHSKIILMRTNENYYVLETSSNLNENPKIEQYSLENSKELYDFYYNFFEILKTANRGNEKKASMCQLSKN
jgi:hypothetical protein